MFNIFSTLPKLYNAYTAKKQPDPYTAQNSSVYKAPAMTQGAPRSQMVGGQQTAVTGSTKAPQSYPVVQQKKTVTQQAPPLAKPPVVPAVAQPTAQQTYEQKYQNYLSQSHWCNPAHMKYSIGFAAYIVMIIFFAYFYTSITFNPKEVAKNLNDRGGFITGIRSGKPTVEYLTNILNYIILIGAIGLIIVAAIPILASGIFGAQVGFGGTSIIIIVGVILETLETIKSMVTEKNYSTIKGIF